MTLEWTTDVAAGDWWVQQLRPFASGVGSLVPDSFEAVTRVFHPIEIDGVPRSRPRRRSPRAS